MFANFINLLSRKPPAAYDSAFIREVRIRPARVRNVRTERLFLVAWILIALKWWAADWAIKRWEIPFDALWIAAPTVLMAAACTWLYFRGE